MEKEKLRYSIIVDGHDNEGYALLEDARCFALTETLNAKEQVEIYDSTLDKVIETYYPELRYSIIVDGHDRIGCELLKDARYFALTETLNAKEQVEIYDSTLDKVIKTYYPEEL